MPAKLIFSVFGAGAEILNKAISLCENAWHGVEMASQLLPFDMTDYYKEEFGAPLLRRFFSLKGLVSQGVLKDVKARAAEFELRYSDNGKRLFNLDPGLITLERLVLATGKNYSHRIYLGDGVFADLTLIYKNGSFQPLNWTYQDYASRETISFWNVVRRAYHKELKDNGLI